MLAVMPSPRPRGTSTIMAPIDDDDRGPISRIRRPSWTDGATCRGSRARLAARSRSRASMPSANVGRQRTAAIGTLRNASRPIADPNPGEHDQPSRRLTARVEPDPHDHRQEWPVRRLVEGR